MATEAEKKALESSLRGNLGTRALYNSRALCADGTMAKFTNQGRAEGRIEPNVGELCLAFIKHSADVHANPAELAKNPSKSLLGLYKAYASDKGYAGTDGIVGSPNMISNDFAERVLGMYNKFSERADAYMAFTGYLPIASKPGKVWGFTPGSAFDAAFTQTALDALAGKPVPAPQATTPQKLAQLAATTNQCFATAEEAEKSGITLGACKDAGREQAAIYVVNKRTGASR